MRRIIGLAAAVFFIFPLRAQVFGGNPPSVKWKQINTDTARVIFPAGQEAQAHRTAAVVHYLAQQKPVSLGDDLRKINIVLQNQTVVSNGYVGLGPYRSEFFLTPFPDNFSEGSISWTDNLAIHEYRHVQQYNNFRNGASKLMYVLFGEEGLAVATNAAVPDWFFEGDAVYSETVNSNQGRGRLPLFLNTYRSLWQEGKSYSFMKLRNGSLKDYVPSHYHLGYLLVNYGNEKYGTDFWKKVTKDASAFKGLFYPMQQAIKRHSGVNYKTFYSEALQYYKLQGGKSSDQSGSLTKEITANAASTGIKTVLPVNKKYVTDYLLPYRIGQDSLLYLKQSFRHLPAFYIRDQQGERKLRLKDISLHDQYSYRNGKIVYAAYEPDARWGYRDYSVIRLLDVKTGEQKRITKRTKYFSPDLSPDGTRIAVASNNAAAGKNELHIIDAANGQLLHTIKSSDIALFSDPRFIDDRQVVTAVRLPDGRMCLALANMESGATERLTPLSYNVVGNPFVKDSKVYFTASYSGNDELYSIDLASKKIFQLLQTDNGNYFPSVAGDKITWSGFTAEGYQLKETDLSSLVVQPVDVAAIQKTEPVFVVSHAEQTGDILNGKLPDASYAVSKYKKGKGLFNFHSWRPDYSDPDFTFTLYGENVLNTFQSQLYYRYNENENSSSVGYSGAYGALFPYIVGGTEYTFNRRVADGSGGVLELSEWNAQAGLRIPLNLTKGKFLRSFTSGANYVYKQQSFNGSLKDSLGTASLGYLHFYTSYNQQLQRARQHIFPRFGYGFAFNHRTSVSSLTGYQFLGTGQLYLPGVARTHSLVLTGAFQQRDTLNPQLYSNRFAFSRGYDEAYFSRMWKGSVNYHFPLWLPDWGLGHLLYVSRIRANAFYDFTRIYSRDKTVTRDFRSAGGELFFDTKWWNQYPVSFGFRVSHLLDPGLFSGQTKGSTWFEFVLPVNLIPD